MEDHQFRRASVNAAVPEPLELTRDTASDGNKSFLSTTAMNRAKDLLRPTYNSGWVMVGLAAVFALHFICFYWWVSGSYYFTGDCLFYFSRPITSFVDLWSKLVSVDELYQYRPLPYVFFTFVLHPLFGTNPGLYHLAAYIIALANILLACGCCYFWLYRDKKRALMASVFLILNPVNFFPSYGLAYIDVLLSLLFYFLALVLILANTRWAPVLAPVFAALALLSRENTVVLPAQALLILLATGVPLRQAVSRTRNVWLVVTAYAVFQLVIRHGAVFAPETANGNLQFDFSLQRVEQLVKGIKPAIYFPENFNLNELLGAFRRYVRLAFVIPWFGMILWVLLRRDRVALSGLIWVPMSLLPIAFIRFPPFPRHYYLALPGLALLFVSVVQSTRVMAFVATVFSLVTLTSVAMYANNSSEADGSRLTKKYFEEIQSMANRTGRTEFYVLNEGDRYFSWHVDGGTPLHQFLNKEISFRFAAASAALPMDLLLSNSINVVIPTWEGFQDVLQTERFPQLRDYSPCGPVRLLIGLEAKCAVFFRGFPVEKTDSPIVETPNGLPIFEVNDEIVMLSRTTVFVDGTSGIRLNATVRAAPESADGVSIQIYKQLLGRFLRIFERDIRPGEQIRLDESFDGSPGSMFALRIGPGAKGDETGDWSIWKTTLR